MKTSRSLCQLCARSGYWNTEPDCGGWCSSIQKVLDHFVNFCGHWNTETDGGGRYWIFGGSTATVDDITEQLSKLAVDRCRGRKLLFSSFLFSSLLFCKAKS